MNRRPSLPVVPLAVLLAALLTAHGCSLLRGPSQQPTQFYVLTGAVDRSAAPDGRKLVLGLGPVTLPSYLDRPEMVSRVESNQLWFDEYNRWGEPLKANVLRVLAGDLDALLNLERVVSYPWYRGTPMSYSVAVAISRLEPQPSGEVELSARWGIGDGEGTVLTSRESRFTRPGGSPAQNAAAMSDLVGDLSTEIATALRALDHP